jgi:hypothetical protein
MFSFYWSHTIGCESHIVINASLVVDNSDPCCTLQGAVILLPRTIVEFGMYDSLLGQHIAGVYRRRVESRKPQHSYHCRTCQEMLDLLLIVS